MGNNYTHLATNDPSELNTMSTRDTTATSQRLSRWAARLTSSDQSAVLKMPRSSTNYMDKHPIMRNPVHSDAVGALAPVRPGMVISGSRDKVIALNNYDTGECVLRWYGHEKEVTKLVYRNAGGKHYILSGSRDATLKLWQFNTPHTLHTFYGHQMSITGLAMIDETRCISGARDATLRIWDITTGMNSQTVQHSRNLVTHISFCHANNLLAQSAEDKELKIWDSRDLHLVHQFPKKRHILTHCDFLPDGNYCLSSSNGFNGDGCEITMWDLRQRKIVREYKGHEESVTCAIYMPQQVTWKRLMISVSADHTARIWNADDGNCLWSEIVPVGADLLACVGFNDGNIVVSGLNASLCHLRLLGKAGRPYLHCVSVQTHSPHSSSVYRLSDT
ncbi:WD repeat-containing protein 31 [Toxocara canis]|uniref:WD repeat-containing protein 31 n=1 Tax=Toxocara canis TaxID=6265 RepID=A0A0B2VQT8_TOXCA|nr:WD repeat-containing protein 31 [Toxocara canis]